MDRKGDYDVHFAKGVRRMVITDTMEQVDGGFEGDALHLCTAKPSLVFLWTF